MLYRHGTTPVHQLPAQVKVVALLVFVLAVVVLPPEAFWAYFLAGCLLVGVMILAELPAGFVARRLLVEVPILIFALMLPFFGRGETTEVLGLTLSVEGLWGAWTILAKATLGLGASIIVSATTTIPDLLRGLDRIRVPRVLTAIAGFMVRYLDIVAGEFSRRRVAMAARGIRAPMALAERAAGPVGRIPLHPIVRAGRACPPGDGGEGIHREDAGVW